MRSTQSLLRQRQPMIKFLGRRFPSKTEDHSPHVHPASPSDQLPDSFATYRQRAQQHGPLGPTRASSADLVHGRSGASFGTVEPTQGEFFDRDELPRRFRRTPFTAEEIDAIETGGASVRA